MTDLRYEAPATLEAAVALLGGAGGVARVLAGGTDVIVQMETELVEPELVVDIKKIPGLRAIAPENGGFRVGAATPAMEMVEHAGLCRAWPGVIDGVKLIGSIQVKGRATIAGNLCNASPAADGVPPLLALDAEIEIAHRSGARRVPLSAFITGNRRTVLMPGELVVAIHVPKPVDDARSAFLKLGARRYLVISIVMAAATLEISGGRVARARVAVGACSAVAQRLPALEAALSGAALDRSLGTQVAPEHLAPLAPIDDVRGTAGYRNDAALTLLRRLLQGFAT